MGLDRVFEKANRIFLDKERVAECILWYRGGNDAGYGEPVQFLGIWDADSLPGTNEIEGDGVALERTGGRRQRDSFTIEVPVSLEVVDTRVPPDRFVRESNNETAMVQRVIGRDDQLMSVRCIRSRDMDNRAVGRRG